MNGTAQSRPRTAAVRSGQVALAASMALLASCGGSATPAAAPSAAYTAFAAPLAVTITGYSGDAMEPFLSKDGQTLFFNSRNDPSVDTNLFAASRVDDQTFTYLGPVAGADSTSLDAVASLDTAGNFYFVSNRSYTTTLSTLYSGHWSGGVVSDVRLVAGVSRDTAGAVNFDAEISADGRTLWFDDGDYASTGALQAASIAVATKQGSGFTRAANSAAVLASVNAQGLDYAPSISVDGTELFFTRVDSTTSQATPSIYRAVRTDGNAAFGTPALVAAATGFVEAPSLSADGHLLYFHQLVDGTFVIRLLRR